MSQVLNSLSAGNIFIKDGTPLPTWFRFPCEEYAGWKKLLEANGDALERTAVETGWHFSYIVTEVTQRAFGLDRESAEESAVKEVMKLVERFGFNSIEITQIAAHQLFALHWVRIVANPRNLKASPFLEDPRPYYYPRSVGDVENIFWRALEVQRQIKGI
jgi:hypothetical protein